VFSKYKVFREDKLEASVGLKASSVHS